MGEPVFNCSVKFSKDDSEPLPPEVDWINLTEKNLLRTLYAIESQLNRVTELKVVRNNGGVT